MFFTLYLRATNEGEEVVSTSYTEIPVISYSRLGGAQAALSSSLSSYVLLIEDECLHEARPGRQHV